MALVLDTGVLYAGLNDRDPDHEACRSLIEGAGEDLVIPDPVLVELDQLCARDDAFGAWVAFAGSLASSRFMIQPVDAVLAASAVRIQVRYADQPIGFVDATVFATCEALGEEKVATLDRRHFGVLRTEDGRALTLLPDV